MTERRRPGIAASVDAAITAARVVAPAETRLVAIGWSSVDLERAEREFGAVFEDAPADVWLGARCRVAVGAFPAALVLLEPVTEGRLAGSLARLGEGPVVSWYEPLGPPSGSGAPSLGPPSGSGAPSTGAPSAGPFGPEWALPSGSSAGRFRFLLGTRTGTMPV